MKIALMIACAIPACILTGFGLAMAATSGARVVYWIKR